jgi:hypothetical protein
MRSRTLRRLFTLAALTLLTATLALAQPAPPASGNTPAASSLVDSLHYSQPKFTRWNSLAEINPGGKLFVVTVAQPSRRQTCRVQSFAPDQLACKGPFGSSRTYKPNDILALIVPGEYDLKIRLVLGLNAALGASIWGTVVLAATCPACAVATGIAAFLFFGAAGGILIGDDMPDCLLYLAPGQTVLQVELRY